MNDLIYRVTFRCNKHCYFCYNDAFDKKVKFDEIEKTDINPLINFIKKNKIKRIAISGGEPTVREDLQNLIKQLNKVTTIKIFSNGNIFDKFTLEQILDLRLSKIVITIYDQDIYGNKKFDEYLDKVDLLRRNGVLIDGNMFLDADYLKKRQYVLSNKLREQFNNIRWQPLVLPTSFKEYKTTIFGMDKKLRDDIFSSVIEDNWGNVGNYYKVFSKYMENNKQPFPCLFPKCVCTVDPDLSVKICPHHNNKSYTFDEIEKVIQNFQFDNCLTSQCLSIYKFD